MSTSIVWYTQGGPVMLLILLVAVAGIAVTLERLYVVVYRSRSKGRVFIERVIQLVRTGKMDEAIKACAATAAALPDMGLLILRSRSRDESDLQNVATAAALHVLPKLNRRIQYLPTLALVAVMLGVLGAVQEIHHGTTIADSMPPLEFGLSVAIVLTLARGYLVSQAEFLTEEVQEFSARLINALIDRPDVRLGHR